MLHQRLEPRPPLAILRALPDAPFAAARRAYLERMFEAFERDDIETAVDMLIGKLDAADGDPDREDCGSEDEGAPFALAGPGCPIADPDGCVARDDVGTSYGGEGGFQSCDGMPGDPDDAELVGDEADTTDAEDEVPATVTAWDHAGPGCPISDPGGVPVPDWEG